MIAAVVNLFTICLLIGLGVAAHAIRDEIIAQDERIARVESLLKKVVALVAAQEQEREVRERPKGGRMTPLEEAAPYCPALTTSICAVCGAPVVWSDESGCWTHEEGIA